VRPRIVKSCFSRISRNLHWLIASLLIPFQGFTNGIPLAFRDHACWKRRQEPQESVVREGGANDLQDRTARQQREPDRVAPVWMDSGGTCENNRALIEQETGKVALDLTEMTLVDRDVVNFLATCELKGIELRNCPAFLREWVNSDKLRIAEEPH